MDSIRGVAQSGSALEWGSSGRRFKSSRPDSFPNKVPPFTGEGPFLIPPGRPTTTAERLTVVEDSSRALIRRIKNQAATD